MNRPPQPVLDPAFWEQRIGEYPGFIRSAMCHCTDEVWNYHKDRHTAALAAVIRPTDSLLDAGCGYGRLLDMLPQDWHGAYLGVDLSPGFIKVAAQTYPTREFRVADLRYAIAGISKKFDWAVGIGLQRMLLVNCGPEVWAQVESTLKAVSTNQLFLNFDGFE